jgi:hypothetical protein
MTAWRRQRARPAARGNWGPTQRWDRMKARTSSAMAKPPRWPRACQYFGASTLLKCRTPHVVVLDPPTSWGVGGTVRRRPVSGRWQCCMSWRGRGCRFGSIWSAVPTRIDPTAALGVVPTRPLPYWGWGTIPDQYGRRWDGDDCELGAAHRGGRDHGHALEAAVDPRGCRHVSGRCLSSGCRHPCRSDHVGPAMSRGSRAGSSRALASDDDVEQEPNRLDHRATHLRHERVTLSATAARTMWNMKGYRRYLTRFAAPARCRTALSTIPNRTGPAHSVPVYQGVAR